MRHLRLASLLPLLVLSATAHAEESEGGGLGLNADLGWASMYVFRGANVFAQDSFQDAHMMLAPSLTWASAGGLEIGYWGAFQLNGDNKQANVDLAIGAEQDLFVTWSRGIAGDALTLTPALYLYSYPLAKYEVVGADFPHFLEPGLTCAWAGPVEIGLQLAWMTSLQEAMRGYSYAYARPFASFEAELGERASIEGALGFGLKALGGDYVTDENRYDAQLDVAGSLVVAGPLYVQPAVHAAWTNSVPLELAQELMFWGSLNLGADF
jgi:hypothetical protein